MAKKKTKKDETVDGVKFPSKDELRKMYLTPKELAREIEEQKIIAEAKKEIN